MEPGSAKHRSNPEGLPLPLQEVGAVRLICDGHFLDVDIIRSEDIFQGGYRFWRKERVSSQDPGIIHVEEPDDGGAGVDKGVVLIIGGQDPVRCGRHH